MKKLLSGVVGAALMVNLLPVNAAEYFLNDGSIVLNGSITDAVLNDEITVNVVRSEFDWDSEEVWKNENYEENSANIKYYDIIKADANGKYSLNFKLNDTDMGKYTVYLGSEYFAVPVTEEFYFTDKDKNSLAITELLNCTSKEDVVDLLKNKRYDLMLYSDNYDSVNLDEAGEAVYIYLSENPKTSLTSAEAVNIIYKGFMVSVLNSGSLTNINDYSDCLGIDGTEISKYIKESYGSVMTEKINNADIESIKDYDEKLFYIAAGCIINKNDGTEGIKAALKEHKSRTNESYIVSDDMLKDIAGQSLYTKDELQKWISDYTSGDSDDGSGSSGGSSHSGSSSGGGGYKSDSYNAAAGYPFNSGYDMPEDSKPESLNGIFTDLDDVEWAREAISTLYSKGIISGRTSTTFEPDDTVLREEFVKLLTAAFELNLISDGGMTFKDVDKSEWYYKYVDCAYAGGIVKGISDELFGIGENVTRQDICVMIDNTLKLCEVSCEDKFEEKTFTDSDQIADYAKESVARMQRLGVINGYEDGSFNPNGNATRAEAAKIIYTINSYISK